MYKKILVPDFRFDLNDELSHILANAWEEYIKTKNRDKLDEIVFEALGFTDQERKDRQEELCSLKNIRKKRSK
ncbi:MAG: hypothetical protein MPK30_08120 [Gammaproteobacteria bacterium]|nr:hypothetical protein [Gammaproteobacteria bacterium]